ncbi:MAG: hypothetical protein KDI68_14610 [Gammaproteobacteria bacterium]|nr:hypothetical protein [Gammaproteobacteria bacterium]
MYRIAAISLFSLLLLVLASEPALANKFTTISGGVNGMSQEKVLFLKKISLYTGAFLLFLAGLALLTRNRFEGFIGYVSKGDVSSIVKGATVLTVIGFIMMLLALI